MVKEKEILIKAREVFLEMGYDGARMQDIADRAGINKALLHYYFRSKENLFKTVLKDVMNEFFPVLYEVMKKHMSIEEKLKIIFEKYIDFLQQNPLVPRFIISEAAKHPELVSEFIKIPKDLKTYQMLSEMVDSSVKNQEIRAIDSFDFLMNLISLSVFPIIAKPLFTAFFEIPDVVYDQLIEKRKKTLPEFFTNGIK